MGQHICTICWFSESPTKRMHFDLQFKTRLNHERLITAEQKHRCKSLSHAHSFSLGFLPQAHPHREGKRSAGLNSSLMEVCLLQSICAIGTLRSFYLSAKKQ
ncbi:uncharacterized protein LOC143693943 isoform X2 [Agelaius phoeniceus]|uniref:uncharacterized protein LOC143693943 isoform X2 n=1 Tax=Agelaius phoeniceus TaxID=39638 RepID=UPI004054F111